jgi:hypothetical protein
LYSACQGQVNPFQEALVQEIGRFIYRVHISGDYFVNFADASARVVPSPAVVYGYGKRIGDAELLAFGAWLADRAGLYASINQVEGYSRGLGRLLAALFLYPELSAVQAQAPLKRDVWLDQIQVMAARDEGYSPSGFYVAAKGGHNDESHNHNDIGHFIVYFDGKPLLVDAGVETYTRKTFSPQRYEIWTMQSAYHALPTIDGIMQSPGRNFAASQVRYQADDQQVEFFLNLAGAYPSEAHLEAYLRRILFQRRAWLEVQDSFSLNAPAGELAMSLLTPCGIDLNAPNLVKLCARSLPANLETATGQIEYSIEGSDPQAARLTVSAERIPIEDSRLAPIWGDHLNRLVFRWTNPPLRGAWRLIVKA